VVGAGRVKLREDLVDGLENAPAAFIGLLEGRNFGKLVVRVADALRAAAVERLRHAGGVECRHGVPLPAAA